MPWAVLVRLDYAGNHPKGMLAFSTALINATSFGRRNEIDKVIRFVRVFIEVQEESHPRVVLAV